MYIHAYIHICDAFEAQGLRFVADLDDLLQMYTYTGRCIHVSEIHTCVYECIHIHMYVYTYCNIILCRYMHIPVYIYILTGCVGSTESS